MAKTNSLKLAPYDKRTGNLLDYVLYEENADWRPNEPFWVGAMHILRSTRGRSSARVIVLDRETGIEYPMFLSSFVELTQQATIYIGVVEEMQWIVVKKGANYGIELYQGEAK